MQKSQWEKTGNNLKQSAMQKYQNTIQKMSNPANKEQGRKTDKQRNKEQLCRVN